MVKNIIKLEDKIYSIYRILSSTTTETDATRIHQSIGTDSLLRDKEGKWFCCYFVKDVEFKDVEIIPTEPNESIPHDGFELQDNGGMG
jgi:hypothetical protein